MRRRHRRQRKSAKVDLNLAAMLDMAFQLLTFFILTFRPAPIEGQLSLHMPPPLPLTNVKTEHRDQLTGSGGDLNSGESLDLYITADDHGQVSQIRVGMRPVVKGRLDAHRQGVLFQHLQSIFGIQSRPFDRIQLVVDARLRYEEFMKVVDVCTKQVMPDGSLLQRISFVPMKGSGK